MLKHIVHAALISDPTHRTMLATLGQMEPGYLCVHVCKVPI